MARTVLLLPILLLAGPLSAYALTPSTPVDELYRATVTIEDDDLDPATNPPVTVTAVDPDASEQALDRGKFQVSLNKAVASADVKVKYTVGGTATAGGDYSKLSGVVVIPKGKSSADIDVIPVDDKETEAPETVVITLAEGTGYSIGNSSSAKVIISDNEVSTKATLKIASVDPYASEQGLVHGKMQISLTSGVTDKDLPVTYKVGGTATAESDYKKLTGKAVIPKGKAWVDIDVTPMDNKETEGPETVVVTLAPEQNYSVSQASSATVTILDNDTAKRPALEVTAVDSGASERKLDKGRFQISLLSGVTADNLAIAYSVNGSATAGSDYEKLTGTGMIPKGKSSVNIDIVPIDDKTVEGPETVVLKLENSSAYSVSLLSSATVTIDDDESSSLPTVKVTTVTPEISERGTDKGLFRIELSSGTASSDLAVKYTVSGDGTPGKDYAALPGKAVIPKGKSSVDINVAAVDDQEVEASEKVILTLTDGDSYRASSNATVNIMDNDIASDPSVNIVAIDPYAAEQGKDKGKFRILLRSGVTADDLVVNYAVSGTATADLDYSPLSGTATIPKGTSSVDIDVTPLEDSEVESLETVIVTLTQSAAYKIGSQPSATVNIADNDFIERPLVKVTAVDPRASEKGLDKGRFEISLANGVVRTNLAVHYKVSGTATPGKDYTALTSVANIPAGKFSTNVDVQPINDREVEGPETVILTLVEGMGYGVAAPPSITE
nr:Calx-beta domain-containing protein [Heliobacterium chlorum]